MRWKFVLIFGILLVIVSLGVVSASFIQGNGTEIEEDYAPGALLRGSLNISLENEPVNSLISSNFQGSINLIDFLDENFLSYPEDFSCIPSDCEEGYVSTNGQPSKSFSLNYGEEKIVSLLIDGTITSIGELEINFSVTNSPGCINPLKIDVLDDGATEWESKKFNNEFACTYETGRGCFDINEVLSPAIIDDEVPYCEKIKLVEGGSFSLGSWVKKGSTSWQSGLLKMYLWDSDNMELESCDLPEPSTSGGEISCTISHENIEAEGYYVCIQATSSINGYETKRESVDSCGFYAEPGEEIEYHDYYIFAKAAKFDNIGEFSFNQEEYEEQNSGQLSDYIFDNYIDDRYEGDCNGGCSIPIKIKAYRDLSVEISSVRLKYHTGAGPDTTTLIYDATKETAEISSDFLILDLEKANISVPASYGSHTVKVYLGGQEILEEEIEVLNVATIEKVLPIVASASVPTKFIVFASGVESYEWDFGDGSKVETTTENTIYHTYPSIGTYNLEITAENEAGKSSKTFSISVRSPEDEINRTLAEKKEKLDNIKGQVDAIAGWYKGEIEKLVKVDEFESEISSLEKRYETASSSSEYIKIMSELIELKIPNSIKVSKSGGSFLPGLDDVNPDYLVELGLKADSPEKYKNPIINWINTNVDLNVENKIYSLYYDDETLILGSVISLKITPKEDFSKETYLVIDKSYEEITFKENYNEKAVKAATVITFSELNVGEEKIIEFISPEQIEIVNLPVYISPDFSELPEVGGGIGVYIPPGLPWKKITIYLIILLFAAFIVYIFLQEWYKRYYEKHLFKNRNDLFNLINFITNALNQGLSKKETIKKLKEYKWGGEQIVYAFKKARGERTGMWEIPIFKSFERRKLKKELEKRRKADVQYPPRRAYKFKKF